MTASFPVPSESVEAGLLYACTSMEQWLELAIFTEDDFTTHRNIYNFFKDHLKEYGNLPTQSQISTRFNWQPPVGEFKYWLIEMKRYSTARKVLSAIQEGYNKISEPEQALSDLLSKLSRIRSDHNHHVQATDAGAMERIEAFDNRTEHVFNSKKILGVPTGMKVYDKQKIGWLSGSLIGCYARPGLGKTWWLMWQGVNAWIDGKTVLAIAPEMPPGRLNLRIDALIANAIGKSLDYNKLLIGDPTVRTEYEFIVQLLSQSSRWWTYDSLEGHDIGLGDIAALINQHSPDVVLIDGIGLLKKEGRGQTWENMKDTCNGLKNIATISEVPIIITHQAVNSGRGRRGSDEDEQGRSNAVTDNFHMPSLNDAAYGDAFVQACSDVITMCAEPTSTHIRWYSIKKYRDREFVDLATRYALAVDFGFGKVYDLSDFGYNPAIVGQETHKLLGKL